MQPLHWSLRVGRCYGLYCFLSCRLNFAGTSPAFPWCGLSITVSTLWTNILNVCCPPYRVAGPLALPTEFLAVRGSSLILHHLWRVRRSWVYGRVFPKALVIFPDKFITLWTKIRVLVGGLMLWVPIHPGIIHVFTHPHSHPSNHPFFTHSSIHTPIYPSIHPTHPSSIYLFIQLFIIYSYILHLFTHPSTHPSFTHILPSSTHLHVPLPIPSRSPTMLDTGV